MRSRHNGMISSKYRISARPHKEPDSPLTESATIPQSGRRVSRRTGLRNDLCDGGGKGCGPVDHDEMTSIGDPDFRDRIQMGQNIRVGAVRAVDIGLWDRAAGGRPCEAPWPGQSGARSETAASASASQSPAKYSFAQPRPWRNRTRSSFPFRDIVASAIDQPSSLRRRVAPGHSVKFFIHNINRL